MKLLICLAGLIAVASCASVPRVSNTIQEGDEWALVPDTDGHLRMVHLSEVLAEEPSPFFVPEVDIVFNLFTRQNPTAPQRILFNNPGSLAQSNFIASRPTRFTAHGWNGGANSGANVNVRDALLARGDFNVISIDWSVGAVHANYITARRNVDVAGPVVGQFVNFLVAHGASLNQIYLSGHSLGGHLVGVAGKNINGLVNTIISLDPAGPLFSLDEPLRRVDATDGQYVEIIQTNANLLGFGPPIGDADFYPNGGNSQPGCGIDASGSCAHDRAVQFYVESINNPNFWSRRCSDRQQPNAEGTTCIASGPSVPMGGEPSNHGRNANGVYWLPTNGATPFAVGPI